MTANRIFRSFHCLLLCCLYASASADENARAHYIANMGVMIESGNIKILFDPLFDNDYGIYDRVQTSVETGLLAGKDPWDGIDAVFISHYHGDHFDPAMILKLLNAHRSIELFGPEQAATAIRALMIDPEDTVLERIHGLSLKEGVAATDIELGALLIEAVRIPHEGWPDMHEDIENLVFRVTLDEETTVMHFGDADPLDEHFARTPEHWQERHTHFAMPPYWFFFSERGRKILQQRIGASHATGLHVPTEVPDDPLSRPENLQDVDLFTSPGETRSIIVTE